MVKHSPECLAMNALVRLLHYLHFMKAKKLLNGRRAEYRHWFLWGVMVCAGLLMAGCAGGGEVRERDYLPGNSPYYSFGIAQSKENFANVKRAQAAKGLLTDWRVWGNFGPGLAPATVGILQSYLPFSVRWELMDGRQFIVEDVDVRSIMKTYFKDKNNDITLPWQREGRQRDSVGDADPALVYEIKDDTLRIKWLISTNLTPVDKRILASGAATKWEWKDEQFLVKEIKGKPAQGINFSEQSEFGKDTLQEKK